MSTCRFGVLRLIKQHNLFQNSLWCKLNPWEGCFKYRKIIQWKKNKKTITQRKNKKSCKKKKLFRNKRVFYNVFPVICGVAELQPAVGCWREMELLTVQRGREALCDNEVTGKKLLWVRGCHSFSAISVCVLCLCMCVPVCHSVIPLAGGKARWKWTPLSWGNVSLRRPQPLN